MRLLRGSVLSIVVGLAASCSSAAPPSTTPTQTLEATARSTPSPTPVQTESILELADGGTMFPGTYRTQFVPAMTITINNLVNLDCAPGYRCRGDIDVNIEHWLDLEFGNDHGAELMVVRLDQVWIDEAKGTAKDPSDDLATWIANRPGITQVSPAVAASVGGIAGTRLDLHPAHDLGFGPNFGIAGPGRAWITVLNVRGSWILVVEVLGPEHTIGTFETVVRGLQPIVDSIVWN
jgi:hypothetical protein